MGFENEELTDLLTENRGWKKQPGGKYHGETGNNGFDHVFTKIDADGDIAGAAVQQALDSNQPIRTAVGGLDKTTGEYKLIMILIPD